MSIELRMNSSAVHGLIGRPVLGKIRRLETGLLWIQHFVDKQVLKLKKRCGKTQNSGDVGIKDLSDADMRHCLAMA